MATRNMMPSSGFEPKSEESSAPTQLMSPIQLYHLCAMCHEFPFDEGVQLLLKVVYYIESCNVYNVHIYVFLCRSLLLLVS